MKRFRLAFAVALAVIAVLGRAATVAADEQVPFKGSFEGDVTVTPAPPFLSVHVEATGNATQLGLFTLDIPHLVNPTDHTANGFYEFTAANGDTVIAKFNGNAMPTAIPGVLYIEEMATIIGGTGRFAGATGSFVSERLYDRVAGTTVGSFEGTITLDDDAND
jgi:hypothetical protein